MINTWADLKGWNQEEKLLPSDILANLMKIVGEVSEAHEDVREDKMETYCDSNGKPCGFPSELADVMIRCLHLGSMLKIDLGYEMASKMEYNYTRTYRHGGKKA
jgi:NTP pyrophosphatase (non-canonical NTP hydrolase)